MSLSANQINAIYAELFGPNNLPDAAQLAAWEALDTTQGDAAVITDIVTSPASMQFDFAVVQLIQFVQGTVPTAAQLQGWVAYLEAGGSQTSVVDAFAESTNFQNNFNGGNPVNINAAVSSTIAFNIIAAALGTVPSASQVQAWVATGISVAQMVTEFALGDQYSARTAPFVENYLYSIAASAAGLPGAHAPTGTLFGVPTNLTITDSTAPAETVTEGNSVTYTVSGLDIANGTTANYALSGATGQVNGPTTGILTFENSTATLTVNTLANILGGSPQPLTLTVSGTNLTTGSDAITITEAQQSITAPASVNEGSTATLTINTTGVPGTLVNGLVENYTITGSAVPGQVTTGSGTVTLDSNGQASIALPVIANVFNTTATESFTVTLLNNASPQTSATVTVNETATISVSAPASETGANSVNEGSNVTFTLAASANVPAGTQVSYTLSGSALGNVPVNFQTGTATVNPGGTVTITVPTLADDNSGLIKDLTITLNNLNNLPADPTVATAQIDENAANVFVLTGTGTYTGNGTPLGHLVNLYDGQPPIEEGNTFFANQTTLGNNEVLTGAGAPNGTTDVLYLTTQGFFPAVITSFTTTNIPVFDINANDTGGTIIDMSSATGVTQIIDDNSSASLTLNNVGGTLGTALTGANGFGGIVIQDPSQIFTANNTLTVNYTGALVNALNTNGISNAFGQHLLQGQTVSMFNSLGPVTGLPTEGLTVTGVLDFTVSTMPGSPGDGLTFLNVGNVLQDVTLTGAGFFVLGDGPGSGLGTPLAFTSANNAFDSSTLAGTVFDLGDAPETFTTAGGNLTISLGAGGMNSTYSSAVAGTVTAAGGGGGPNEATVNSNGGNVTLNIGSGNAIGQGILTGGGGATIDSINGGGGGYVAGTNNADVYSDGGSVGITGITGLGGGSSFITTNKGASTTAGTLNISGVNGNITEQISTGVAQATINEGANTGVMTFDFSENPNSLEAFGGSKSLGGGNQTGFHTALSGPGTQDILVGNGANSTLEFDPSINNVGSPSGEGQATNVKNLILQSPLGNTWSGAGNAVNFQTLNQTSIVQNITVTTKVGNPWFENLVSNDTINMNTSTATYTMDIGELVAAGAVLNLNVLNGANVTVKDDANGGHTLGSAAAGGTLNFSDNGAATLSLVNDNNLTTLGLVSGGVTIGGATAGAESITTVNGGGDNSTIDLTNLAPILSTTTTPAAPGHITLGNGNDDTVVVSNITAGRDGSWDITVGTGINDSVSIKPQFGDVDVVNIGLGASGAVDDVVHVSGAGGIWSVFGGSGDTEVIVDQSNPFDLTSADTINFTGGFNEVAIINGALNENDSIFANWHNVELLDLAGGFNNSLQLDVLANASGLEQIETGGAGSSQTIIAGPGFTNPLLVNLFANGADTGGDSIQFQHVTDGPLTVYATPTEFNISFEGAVDNAQAQPEGIFANSAQQNLLDLVADNTFADIAGPAFSNVQTIDGIPGDALNNIGEGVFLVNNGAVSPNEAVNLSGVGGTTTIWGQNITSTGITATGGSGTDVVIGAAHSGNVLTAAGTTADFIYSPGGHAATETGAGGAGGASTDFIFNDVFTESPGGTAGPTVPTNDVTITNFNPTTDKISINPTFLFGGGVTFVGNAANYSAALAMLNPGSATSQAVYEQDNGTLWITGDSAADQSVLDASSAQIVIDPISLNAGDVSTTISGGATSGLSYSGGSITIGVPSALTFDLTIPVWNATYPSEPALTTATFIGAGGTLETTTSVPNYNFSALSSGVTVTTQAFNGGSALSGTITGTNFDDSFKVSTADLAAGLVINDGTSGGNQLTINNADGGPTTVTLGNHVTNVQTLNLAGTTGNWTISFGAGQQFKNINDESGGNTTINTANLNAGGEIDLVDGKADIVNLAANLSGTTIVLGPFGTQTVNLDFLSPSGMAIEGEFGSGDILGLAAAGGGTYDLEAALIAGVDVLSDAHAGDKIDLSGNQVGSPNGFIKMTFGGAETISLTAATNINTELGSNTANFSSVTFTNPGNHVTLNEQAGETVDMLSTQLATITTIAGNGSSDTLVFTDNTGSPTLTAATGSWSGLGLVEWGTGTLTIDNPGGPNSNHGITGLEAGVDGGGSGTLEVVNGSIDLSGLTTWSGINVVDDNLFKSSTLLLNNTEAVSIADLNGTIQADGNGGGGVGTLETLSIVASGSYDLTDGGTAGLSVTNVNGGSFTTLNLDVDNHNGITVTTTGSVFDPSITTVTGGAGVNDTLIVNQFGFSDTTDLSHITNFSGFQNVTVTQEFGGDITDTFDVTDVISSYTNSHSGTAQITGLAQNSATQIADLFTTADSARTVDNTGFDTAWNITSFNAGTVSNHDVLQITDTTFSNASPSGVNFINTTGQDLVGTEFNLINANVAAVSNPTDLTVNGNVEQELINIAALHNDASAHGVSGTNASPEHIYVGVYTAAPAATPELAVYELVINAGGGAALTDSNISVNLIGVIDGVANNSLVTANFH